MKHFNQLTPAELERIGIGIEEAGEVLQIFGKIIRHGYESSNPCLKNADTNRTLLEKELGDLLHAVERLKESGDINYTNVLNQKEHKKKAIERWLHHQDKE